MHFYVCRHGETEGNAERLVQGWTGGKLTVNGLKQAEKLSHKIAKVKPDLFVLSDLGRCQETYEKIVAVNTDLKNVKKVSDARLRERFFGSLEGASSEGIDWAYFWVRSNDASEFGEESNNIFRARVANLVTELPSILAGAEVVVCVTHGGVVNILKNFELGAKFSPETHTHASLVPIDFGKLVRGATAYLNS